MGIDLRLARSDLVVGTVALKIHCPDSVHKARIGKVDKTNSLAVYPDNLHCYGCGFHMNNLHEALGFLLGISEFAARDIAHKFDNETLDAYRERAAEEAKKDPLPKALAAVYHEMLANGPRHDRLDWLYDRSLNASIIVDAQLGHDGQRWVIPVFDAEDNLLTLRYRRDDRYLPEDYPKYSGMSGRNGLYLYPEPFMVGHHQNFVVLTEGELDALMLWQHGIPALSATNGAGQVKKLPALIKERYPHIEALIIATDNDEAGEVAAMGMTNDKDEFIPGAVQVGQDLGFRMYRLQWEGHAKDVSEAITGGQLDPARWREYVATV